jgi:hypothetical protein
MSEKKNTPAIPAHYQFGGKFEAIAVLENFAQRGNIPAVKRMHLTKALKSLLRAGKKGDWSADALKAQDYITRALTGNWAQMAGK